MNTNGTGTLLLAALALATGRSVARPVTVIESPCRSGNDTTMLALNIVQHVIAASDSAGVLEPDNVSVTLVTDSVTCQAIVSSYNAARVGPDSVLRVNSGFIVQAVVPPADTAYAMYVPATAGPPPRTEELAHFSKTFQLQLIQAGLN